MVEEYSYFTTIYSESALYIIIIYSGSTILLEKYLPGKRNLNLQVFTMEADSYRSKILTLLPLMTQEHSDFTTVYSGNTF